MPPDHLQNDRADIMVFVRNLFPEFIRAQKSVFALRHPSQRVIPFGEPRSRGAASAGRAAGGRSKKPSGKSGEFKSLAIAGDGQGGENSGSQSAHRRSIHCRAAFARGIIVLLFSTH
jgi:hypothetical protein